MINWGKPERTPHRSVVDVGGTSIACPTIYTTYTVVSWLVGWWYERPMLNNLRFIHASHCQLDEQPWSRVDGQQQRQTKEKKVKGQIKKTKATVIFTVFADDQ